MFVSFISASWAPGGNREAVKVVTEVEGLDGEVGSLLRPVEKRTGELMNMLLAREAFPLTFQTRRAH